MKYIKETNLTSQEIVKILQDNGIESRIIKNKMLKLPFNTIIYNDEQEISFSMKQPWWIYLLACFPYVVIQSYNISNGTGMGAIELGICIGLGIFVATGLYQICTSKQRKELIRKVIEIFNLQQLDF